MASPNESSSSKRRLGRRRLPPLEPGPALQFVVANHPDQFRAGKTMRHVRSHVMYKHRIERKTTPSDKANNIERSTASAYASSTPSPMATSSEDLPTELTSFLSTQSRPRSSTWTGGRPECVSYTTSPITLRILVHHILSRTAEEFVQSAPPVFENASAFPFPGMHGTAGDPLDDLRQQYINQSDFICNSMLSFTYDRGLC
jgi:hypothetical protein